MTTGIKITFSVDPSDSGAVLSTVALAPTGVSVFGKKDFKKHTRFIIRFRNVKQLDKFFDEFGKQCTGKYVFLKKPKKPRLTRKVYLVKPEKQSA
jgi:hypothetical protein